MALMDLKQLIARVEPTLGDGPFVVLHTLSRDGRTLHLALTERLRQRARRGRVWGSRELLTALKNAEYGFDATRARSRGGADGIFLLDRAFRPRNEMMRKIFDRYLDRPGSGAEEVAAALGATVDELAGARMVSHHLRLLGVLRPGQREDWLVLVDYDDTR